MGEGERASGARGSSGQGRVSSELHARRGRGEGGRAQLGGGYAGTTGLTARAREQRERGERRRARERGSCADRRARRGRERGGERGARGGGGGNGPTGPKGRGGAGWRASFSFLFILNCFSLFFLLSLFDSNSNKPQIQTKPSKNYAPSKSEI